MDLYQALVYPLAHLFISLFLYVHFKTNDHTLILKFGVVSVHIVHSFPFLFETESCCAHCPIQVGLQLVIQVSQQIAGIIAVPHHAQTFCIFLIK